MSELRRTPLYALHAELGARFTPFAGYEMPVQYKEGLRSEHLHTREQAGLFDVSHMGQVRVTGPGSLWSNTSSLQVGEFGIGSLRIENGGAVTGGNCNIATNNGATRVWFAMARSGSLPQSLAKVHPRFQTPVNAVILQAVVTLTVGLGLGVWIGPDKEFELMGAVVTFALIFIYSAGNLGVFLLYSRERTEDFHWILHAVFPLLGTLALFFVGYSSLAPWPTPPVAYAPWMVGIWLGVGIAVLLVMRLTGREQWMLKAGSITQDRADHLKQ